MSQTPNRAREMPGVQMRCSPRLAPTTRTSESKSARALAAARTNARATPSRLLMFRPSRNPELSFERGQLVEIDRTDEVDDRQLPRLGGDDHQSGDAVAARQRVDLGVLARAALYRYDLFPFRTELRVHVVDDRAVVRPV